MKSLLRYLSLFICMSVFSIPTWAALTYVSMGGVSQVDALVLTKPVGYAGFVGACATGADGISTCNSCTGTEINVTGASFTKTKLWPCSTRSAYRNLNFVIRAQYTLTGLVNANSEVTLKQDTVTISGIKATYEATGNILNVQIPWGTLCSAGDSGSGGLCNFDRTYTLEVQSQGGGNSNGTTESMTFRLVAREVAVGTTVGDDWHYKDCADPSQATGYGACHFEAYPGDAKIYANNIQTPNSFPSTNVGAIEMHKILFFYAPYDGVSDISTIQSISNASPYFEVSVVKTAKPPISDNRMEGLTNGLRYCFVMASQDITGIVSYFSPHIDSGDAVTSEMCSSPSEVVGLLDDKECFIATAAFGSVMSPQVQVFRDFRDRYLLSNSIGKKFVQTYYKYSPEAVHYLAQSEALRTVIRGLLWPVLWFAQLAMQFGLSAVLGVLLSATLSFIGLFKLGRRYL